MFNRGLLIAGSLDKHHRTHTGERPFSCDVCEQRFTEKGALLRHKASKHEEGRPHGCHICSKTFKGKICLSCQRQYRMKRSIYNELLCSFFFVLSAKEQLRVHLRRHKGMRKFECANCGYKFTRQVWVRKTLVNAVSSTTCGQDACPACLVSNFSPQTHNPWLRRPAPYPLGHWGTGTGKGRSISGLLGLCLLYFFKQSMVQIQQGKEIGACTLGHPRSYASCSRKPIE